MNIRYWKTGTRNSDSGKCPPRISRSFLSQYVLWRWKYYYSSRRKPQYWSLWYNRTESLNHCWGWIFNRYPYFFLGRFRTIVGYILHQSHLCQQNIDQKSSPYQIEDKKEGEVLKTSLFLFFRNEQIKRSVWFREFFQKTSLFLDRFTHYQENRTNFVRNRG